MTSRQLTVDWLPKTDLTWRYMPLLGRVVPGKKRKKKQKTNKTNIQPGNKRQEKHEVHVVSGNSGSNNVH